MKFSRKTKLLFASIIALAILSVYFLSRNENQNISKEENASQSHVRVFGENHFNSKESSTEIKTESKSKNSSANADLLKADLDYKKMMKSLEPMGREFDEDIIGYNDYFPIDKETLPHLISEIKLQNADIITEHQQQDIISNVESFVYAYNVGNTDLILANRLKAEYSVRSQAILGLKNVVRNYLKDDEEMPVEPNEIIRMFVDRRFAGKNGSGHANLFNELSVDGSNIKFSEHKTIPQTINDYLTNLAKMEINRFSNGFVNFNPTIEYKNSPEAILEKNGSLLCADVRLAATDSDNKKYSRYIRYYWSEDDQTWLPMEIVFLYGRQRKADPFF